MTAYKIDELADKAQVSPRTIRYYVQRGLLPAPEFRGKDTTYGADHLLRLRAIKKLQQAHLPLEEIQARIASASRGELERIAGAEEVFAAPPIPPEPPRRGGGGPYRCPGVIEDLPGRAPITKTSERWERISLRSGLELHVRDDAGPEARRIAREILSQYGQGSFVE